MRQGRVLYVINGFARGGAEHGFKTMLEHGFLKDRDVRVFAICEGSPEVRAAIEALLPPGALHVVSRRPTLTLSAMLKAAWALRRLLSAFEPGAVILSLKQANILGRMLLLRRPEVHCVAFEHISRLEHGRLTPLYGFLLKRLSHRVDEVWADCRATLAGARAYYTPRTRTERVAPLFVAPPDAPKKECFAAGAPFRVVTAGRLIPRKRVDVIIEAIGRLRDRGHKVTLTVFGDGPQRSALERLAARLGLSGSVTFRGFEPSWHEHALHQDLFVHLSDDEGFCIVVAEAMMVGLPVIASPVGGVIEYMDDGQDGVYAPKADAATLADLMAQLMPAEVRRKTLGESAARRIRGAFAPHAIRAQLAALTMAVTREKAADASAAYDNRKLTAAASLRGDE